MSIEAADRLRIAEQKIKRAKTEEERKQARLEENVYRLNLIFTSEEATVVKGVLGNDPARKLYELCKEKAG